MADLLECSLFGFLELPSCRRLGFLGFWSFCVLALEKKKSNKITIQAISLHSAKRKIHFSLPTNLGYISQTWNITFLVLTHLRNRKHELRFYWVLQKCKWKFGRKRNADVAQANRQVFPQLIRVLPNFHECFY